MVSTLDNLELRHRYSLTPFQIYCSEYNVELYNVEL